jgi:hypothetical protein
MNSTLKKSFFITIAAGIAVKLFLFGLSYPLELRLLGDAYQYLKIADGLPGFSSAFNYAGDRTIGFPLFEY